MNPKSTLVLVILAGIVLPLTALASAGTIDSTSKYAWGSNTGFVNFNPSNGNVQVTDSALTGDVWSDTYGWINLNPTNSGVKNDGTGVLSGYAWGQNTGYISFSGVAINSSGVFTGTATSSVIGTLTFDCTNCKVITTWRPVAPTPTPSSGGGGSYGGSSGGGSYSAPTPTPTTTPTPFPTTLPSSSLAFPVAASVRLVRNKGTFYVIQNGEIQGVTSPGILFSYGFGFSDAVPATAADLALPKGDLLLPSGGALVKSQQDRTVYLIADGQRHAFTSANVFAALGFKFSNVLLVTNPELQILPRAADISSSTDPHFDGADINAQGTIYWIDNHTRFPYPSLAVYESWHKSLGLSTVVPANSADLQLPVGATVVARQID